MYRQSPSRNQRSKGIRIKHVLQICLLLAVCFWLIYQVKHSHDKKKEFDETDAKTLIERSSSDGFIKLGRKDIHPRLEETIPKNTKHDDTTEEDGEEDVEENRHEEDETKNEAKEDSKGVGDDETDEHEQENSDGEVDREEDVVDDEEKTGDDENEIQETDPEDGHNGEIEKENSTDGDDGSTHEAREEQYKADDASSAVTHDTQINSNEHPENNLEEEKKESNGGENEGKNRRDLEGATDGQQSNATTTGESKAVDMIEDNSEKGSSPNDTVITDGTNDHLPGNSSSEVMLESRDLSTQNVTESELMEGINNSTTIPDINHLESNSTASDETKDGELESHSAEFSDSSNNISSNTTESSALGKVTESDASVEAGNNRTISSSENRYGFTGKTSDSTDSSDETLESTTDIPEEVHHDLIDISDTSNSMEETNVRTDLDTLPQIQTEGTESEDLAAE